MQWVMSECDKYQIRLANDPTVLGPKYLQDMIATCRNHTNQVVLLLNEVRRSKMEIDFELRRKETAFKIAADGLLATNPIVRNLPNIKDRESQINIILKDEHREIMNLKNDALDLEHVEDFVKLRHRELKDTMREIQTQRGLIRDEHETGAMYGDERPTAMGGGADAMQAAFTPGVHARPEGIDEDDIEKMLEANGAPEEPVIEKAEPVKAAPATPVAGPKEPASEEDEIRDFLAVPAEEPSAPAPVVTVSVPAMPMQSAVADNDFTDLFDNL
jgi:hypothetical protein